MFIVITNSKHLMTLSVNILILICMFIRMFCEPSITQIKHHKAKSVTKHYLCSQIDLNVCFSASPWKTFTQTVRLRCARESSDMTDTDGAC